MKIFEIIDNIISKVIDPTGRTQRQFMVIRRWAAAYFHGTFEGCTGFGKTRIGFEAVKLLRRNDPTRTVIVVVPTIPLQEQWIKLLADARMEDVEVWVINSLSASTMRHTCDLLVLDEIHRYAAETFSKVFNVVTYKYVLGLTATIERSDGKHVMLQRKAPIVDRVPLHVARAKGWVSDFGTINYGITLSPGDQQQYDILYGKESKLGKWMAVFNYDLSNIIQCSTGVKPRYDPSTNRWFDPPAVRTARRCGWRGNNAYQASQIARANREAPRGQKQDIWGGDGPYKPNLIVGYAVQARKLIAERKNYINNHPLKTQAVIAIYNLLKWKTISFCETKEAARDIYRAIGDQAVLYHSQMESEPREFVVSKPYKTKKGAEKYMAKHPDIRFDFTEKDGNFILSWKKIKLVGESFLKKEALRKLTDNRYKINFISSVRSLNEGIDIPDLELALIHSRNSTKRDNIQRTGRVARLFVYKDGRDKMPLVINIYLKNTKDEDWLKSSTREVVGARWIDSIEEILSADSYELVA